MRKLFIVVALFMAMSAQAQESYKREGNTFTAVITSKVRDVRANADSTKLVWADTKGVRRAIWVTRSTGSCFVIRTSQRTGSEYRQYLGREVSAAVCKELGRSYTPRTTK